VPQISGSLYFEVYKMKITIDDKFLIIFFIDQNKEKIYGIAQKLFNLMWYNKYGLL